MYNVADPIDEEMSLAVGPAVAASTSTHGDSGSIVVSFDFGGPDGWDRFCIYVVCDNGSLYCFCPIVPRGRYVP